MEEFELYYARLETCTYTYLLDRLSGKQRHKISPGSFMIAIISGDLTRVTEHNHVLYNISQAAAYPNKYTSRATRFGFVSLKFLSNFYNT